MLNETTRETEPIHSTLLALVQSLTNDISSPEDVVENAIDLVNSGHVVLTGNFKRYRF
jgi:hypothetical protein